MKKVIILIAGLIILFCGGILGGKLYADRTNKNNSTNKQITSNTVSVPQQKVDNNEIDGFDLGILTKDQFHQAESLGEKYKSRNIFVNNTNAILYSEEHFKNTYVSSMSVLTPYTQVINESSKLAKNYKDINDDSIVEQLKSNKINLNTIICVATVGGHLPDFQKEDNIVVIIHNQDGSEKTLQATQISNDSMNDEKTTEFFPYDPVYQNTIGGEFDITGLKDIKSIDIKIIQPNMPEVSQSFDWNQLNQL